MKAFYVLGVVLLLLTLVLPALAQDEPEATLPPDEVVTIETPQVITVETPAPADVPDEVLLLAVVGFVAVVVVAVVHALKTGDILKSYNDLVKATVENRGLADTVESRYFKLTPEQRTLADKFFDGLIYISKLTPTEVDDELKTWAGRVRDGQPNT